MSMTNSKLRWHLARDNQAKLVRFCEKHKTDIQWDLHSTRYPMAKFVFDNGGFIRVELEQGTSTAEYFQVIDYGWGTK